MSYLYLLSKEEFAFADFFSLWVDPTDEGIKKFTEEQILSIKGRHHIRRAILSMETNKKSKFISFCKTFEKYGGWLAHHNRIISNFSADTPAYIEVA